MKRIYLVIYLITTIFHLSPKIYDYKYFRMDFGIMINLKTL